MPSLGSPPGNPFSLCTLTLRGRLKRSARALRAQCARSATIWAPGRSGNPYFVVLWASLLFSSRF